MARCGCCTPRRSSGMRRTVPVPSVAILTSSSSGDTWSQSSGSGGWAMLAVTWQRKEAAAADALGVHDWPTLRERIKTYIGHPAVELVKGFFNVSLTPQLARRLTRDLHLRPALCARNAAHARGRAQLTAKPRAWC